MIILRMLDAPSVGRWDAAAWDQIARGAAELVDFVPDILAPFSRRYTPGEVAVAVYGSGPR